MDNSILTITNLICTQDFVEDIPAVKDLVKNIRDNPDLAVQKISLFQNKDDEIFVHSGHDRLLAFYLAGWSSIGSANYTLYKTKNYETDVRLTFYEYTQKVDMVKTFLGEN